MKGISTPTQDRLAASDVVGGDLGLPRTRGLRLGRGVWRGASLGLCGLWLALGAAIPAAAQDFGDATVPDQVWTVGVAEALTLPAATAATAYTLTFDAALPSGVSFDAATRVLAGELSAVVAAINMTYTAVPATTPPQFFFFSFTGVAAPTLSGQDDLSFTIGNRIGQSLPEGAEGAQPLSYTLMSTEATPRTVVEAAPGLAYDAARNFLFGTPQLSFSQDFVHTVEDANGATAEQTFTITATADATAPDLSYTAPSALTVGVAITPLAPITAATDVLSYSLDSGTLPEGLELQSVTGYISGTPSTANTATAAVTLGVSDKSGNSGSYALTFPAVTKGAQALNEFDYRPRLAAVGDALTFTAPTGNVGDLSFSSADAAICTVDSAGALTLVAEGNCVITATALATDDYTAGTASVTVIVLADDAAAGTDIQDQFPDHMRTAIATALTLTLPASATFTDKQVAGLTELSFEAGDGNAVADDIRGLKFATGLTYLNLRNLDINPATGAANSSLSAIAGLTQLTRLEMRSVHSTEFASLKGLVNLEYLDISGHQESFANIEGLLENPGLGAGDMVEMSGSGSDVVPFEALATVLALEARGVEVISISTTLFSTELGVASASASVGPITQHFHLLTISEPIEVEASVDAPDTAAALVYIQRVGNEEILAQIQNGAGSPLNEQTLRSPLLEPGEYAIRVLNNDSSDLSYSLTVNAVEKDFEEGMELSSDQNAEHVFTYTDSANDDLVVTVVGQVNTAMTFAEGAASVALPASLGDLGGASRADVSVDFLPVAADVAALPAEFTFEGLGDEDYTKVDINVDVRPVPATAFGVRVCLPVTANLNRLARPLLLHYTGGAWTQVEEARYEAANRRICVADFPQDNFSPFAVGAVEREELPLGQRSDALERAVGVMSRSTAQTVVNIISRRLGAAPQDQAQAQMAGYSLHSDNWSDSFARQFYADAKALGQGKDLQLAKALRASSFTLPLFDQGVTLWGATGGMKFDGIHEDGNLSTDYDGEVFSVLFGVDGAMGADRRLGVALGYSDGDLEYTGSSGNLRDVGEIEQTMLGVYPYMSWHPRAGLSLWVLGGIGVGEYDISKQPENGPVDQADSVDATQWTLALGGEKAVFTEDKWNDNWDAVLRVKGLWNVLELDDVVYDSGEEVPELDAESWRFALENEMGYRFALSGGASIRPYGLVGLRWDSGDVVGDDSVFVDASGGLVFESAAGLALDVAFRAQLNNGDTEEHALTATGSLSYDSAQDGRGFQLALKHDMGGFGGLSSRHSSWDAYDFNDTPAALSPSDAARMETELGYAWPLQPLRKMRPGVLQTYLRSTFQDTADRHAVGFNFRTPTLDLRLEAAHHQPTSVSGLSAPSAEALLKAQLRF